MQKLEVFGTNKLKGQIDISGSKNASLPVLAATLLSDKKIYLRNLPKVKDIETCLLYTSEDAEEKRGVALGGRRIIKK